MKTDTLQHIVSGLLSLILGVIGYLLAQANEDIRDLKHQMDLHVSEANQRLEQAESELDDLWSKYNELTATDKEREHRITKLECNER